MAFKQVLDIYELLDDARVDGLKVADWFTAQFGCEMQVTRVTSAKEYTDFVRLMIPGTEGKITGGSAPSLGLIGRLGGIGARPERIGLVSDADGAIVALAAAAKLLSMAQRGDILPGDVIVSTHICPHAPTMPHDPVPFMSSPMDMTTMNKYEVSADMDAILSIDTTKGNCIVNAKGVAITPTVKEGYVLPVSNDLVEILQYATGSRAVILPLSIYDITPYGNGLPHVNSIMQPATATSAPVVGVAITAEVPVPGCATGASHVPDLDAATRFCLEVAKSYGAGKTSFYNCEHLDIAQCLYGQLTCFQAK